MLSLGNIQAYLRLPPPVLTAYLDANPAKDSNRRPIPEYRTWLRAEARKLGQALPGGEAKLFREQLERIESFLDDRAEGEHGMLIFAGSRVWEAVPLREEVANELHWGAPSVAQLVWLHEEHKPYCVVVIDRTRARYFRFHLGELAQLGERKFEVDVSTWAKKDMGKFAGPRESSLRGAPGMKKTRGSQRDIFQHRMDAQYARLCRETAEQAARWTENGKLNAVFLIGSGHLIRTVAGAFPSEFAQPIVKIERDLGRIEPRHLAQRLAPSICQWEQTRECGLVASLLDDNPGKVAGVDETLVYLQRGRIRTLLVARDFDDVLHRCGRCGWADRSADVACPVCGGKRQRIVLRQCLPELAQKHDTRIEVVSGDAAERLKAVGGVGGWLQQPKEAVPPKAFKLTV